MMRHVMVGAVGLCCIVRLNMGKMVANHAVAFKVFAVTHQTRSMLESMQCDGVHSFKTGYQ